MPFISTAIPSAKVMPFRPPMAWPPSTSSSVRAVSKSPVLSVFIGCLTPSADYQSRSRQAARQLGQSCVIPNEVRDLSATEDSPERFLAPLGMTALHSLAHQNTDIALPQGSGLLPRSSA